jgi:hypothetical protein
MFQYFVSAFALVGCERVGSKRPLARQQRSIGWCQYSLQIPHPSYCKAVNLISLNTELLAVANVMINRIMHICWGTPSTKSAALCLIALPCTGEYTLSILLHEAQSPRLTYNDQLCKWSPYSQFNLEHLSGSGPCTRIEHNICSGSSSTVFP